MKKISIGKITFESIETAQSDVADEDKRFAGFGSFNSVCHKSSSSKAVDDDTQNQEDDMAKVMGFGEFGGKKAKQFDLDSLVQKSLERINEQKCVEVHDGDRGGSCPEQDATGSGSTPADDDEEELIGPPILSSVSAETNSTAADADSDDISDDSSDDEDPSSWIPHAQSIGLGHGSKPVTALTVDPAGARVVTGAVDFEVRYWDFNGMNIGLKHFRESRPFGSYPINDIQYSTSGDRAVMVSCNPRVKLVDRDGVELLETMAGDMYITDMKRTKGHVGAVHAAAWHVKERDEFLTCSADGTLRVWSVEGATSGHRCLVKPRASNGLKAVPTTCSYSRDGHLVAAGCTDGSLQMWDHRKNYVNTCLLARDAHVRGTETSSLVFSYDGTCVATRGGDETLKLWDLRQFRKPLHSVDGLFNKFTSSDCVFSPNDQLIVTGSSLERGDSVGHLHFYSRTNFDKVAQLPVSESHVIRVVWHPRINQLILGCGDGVCKVFYDPIKSQRGALLCTARKKAKVKQMEVMKNTVVITPHALRMFREPRKGSTLKQMEKARKDPVKSHRPDLPQGKSGTGGRVAAGGSTLASYVMRTLGKEAKKREEGDPREALLKYAKEAAENPYWVTPAYSKTQPKQIFQSTTTEEGEPDPKKQKT